MTPAIKRVLTDELAASRSAEGNGDLATAWRHLERAHILSQPFGLPHVLVHGRMLGFAARRRDLRELGGQLIRLFLAAPASWLGRAPLGNTGGANVGIVVPMPIPEDLQRLLQNQSAHAVERTAA